MTTSDVFPAYTHFNLQAIRGLQGLLLSLLPYIIFNFPWSLLLSTFKGL